jgi:hypothetical protein
MYKEKVKDELDRILDARIIEPVEESNGSFQWWCGTIRQEESGSTWI